MRTSQADRSVTWSPRARPPRWRNVSARRPMFHVSNPSTSFRREPPSTTFRGCRCARRSEGNQRRPVLQPRFAWRPLRAAFYAAALHCFHPRGHTFPVFLTRTSRVLLFVVLQPDSMATRFLVVDDDEAI